MGNCIKNPIKGITKNLNESSPLLSNIDKLQKITNKEICAVCEKSCHILLEIKDSKYPNLSNMVYCKSCKEKLGY